MYTDSITETTNKQSTKQVDTHQIKNRQTINQTIAHTYIKFTNSQTINETNKHTYITEQADKYSIKQTNTHTSHKQTDKR